MVTNLQNQYQRRFSPLQQYRNEVWKILTRAFFRRYITPSSDVLDLGCGWGEFINHIQANRKLGMDLNPDARQYLHPSVEFINQDCSTPWSLPENSLDIVFTSNFLEHLPSKTHVEQTLVQAKRCLKPNGKLICIGPNIKYLPGLYWDFWDHHVPISETSLSELLELHQFSVQECLDKFLPYTMANKPPPPLVFVKIYLKFPIAWKIVGKQFFIVSNNIK